MRSISPAALAGSALLAAVAGYVDAIGFILSGGLFVSFMSGNSTQAGVESVAGHPMTAVVAGVIVLCFVLGVTVHRVAVLTVPRLRGAPLLAGLAVLTALASAVATSGHAMVVALGLLALVMGGMNTLFVKQGRAQVAITYTTGTLVSLGLALASLFTGGERTAWARPLLLWASLSLGALTGAVAHHLLGPSSLHLAAVAILAAAVMTWLRARRASRPATADGSTEPVR